MHTVIPRVLSFDAYTVDLQQCLLLRGADQIQLRPKSFEVLRYLAEHAGRLDQFLLRHQAAGVLGEIPQHVEGFRAEGNLLMSPQQQALLQVESKGIEAQYPGGDRIPVSYTHLTLPTIYSV